MIFGVVAVDAVVAVGKQRIRIVSSIVAATAAHSSLERSRLIVISLIFLNSLRRDWRWRVELLSYSRRFTPTAISSGRTHIGARQHILWGALVVRIPE